MEEKEVQIKDLPEVKVDISQFHTFKELKELYYTYIFNETDRGNIEKAFSYAAKKHEGQFRKSGEAYIHHPLEVAYILASIYAGPSTIIAGLLHDVIEDTNTPITEVVELFGTDVAYLVDSLTKIQRLKLSKKMDVDFEAEDHRKIFLGMAKDIRVIIIKLADRLHNLRTLDFLKPERQIAIAKETIEVFAPIAHRLGMFKIKSELEDLSLKYIEPEIYNNIVSLLDKKTKNRIKSLDNLKVRIANILLKANIPFEMEARIKSIYSIYKKIYKKMHNFEDIYDLLAVRIITDTEIQCYEILGLIHATYKPIPGRFKDYVAVPKQNMYQSLHTTIMAGDGNIYEVQIRTKEMDEIAETGVAAHWRYKEGANYNPRQEQKEIEEKLHWFREFLEISNQKNLSSNAKEYMDTLSKDIFESSVFVFTPKGKVIDLPMGSTPVDFAYKIHTKVGDTTIGALVNGQLVSLNTVLKTADIVEIRTSQNSPGPNEGWLKFVKTSTAQNNIKKFLMKKNADILREEKIEKGKAALIEGFKNTGLTENQIIDLISTEKLLKNYHVSTIEDLFIQISNHNPTPAGIIDFLKIKENKAKFNFVNKSKTVNTKAPILVDNNADLHVSLANCCSPIPGDDIVGYITKGQGISVHRRNCPNVIRKTERLIDVQWNENLGISSYPVDIEITASDRGELIVDIMNNLSTHKISVSQLNAKVHNSTLTVTVTLTIYVPDSKTLKDVFNVLTNIKGVFKIERVIH